MKKRQNKHALPPQTTIAKQGETIDPSAQTPNLPDETNDQDNTETPVEWEQMDGMPYSSSEQTSTRDSLTATNTPVPNFGGEVFSYFFICKRKCWLHAHRIHLQHESEAVALGKLLHMISFPREKQKEFAIEGAKIDFLDKTSIVHEIKSSDSFEDAHIEQVKFYLYLLSLRGFPDPKGRIHYPKLKKTVDVGFTKEDLQRISQQIQQIQAFLLLEKPPKQPHTALCKKCSYEEFCWG